MLALAVPYRVPDVGKDTVVLAVVVMVVSKAPDVTSELPLAKVKVAEVAGAVIVTLLTLVALATPNVGVTRVGEVLNTIDPVPVSSVTALIRLAELGVPRNTAMFAARPETPVLIGSPVALVKTPEAGVPRAGATKVLLLSV
jgi:hypothetical protein